MKNNRESKHLYPLAAGQALARFPLMSVQRKIGRHLSKPSPILPRNTNSMALILSTLILFIPDSVGSEIPYV
jgi:hypothetical protein